MLSNRLTVVMYHYVRPITGSAYPGIRGLELSDFEAQLEYITRHYNVISVADLVASVTDGKPLPDAPLILSFDDGYSDHYRHAFPVLKRRSLSGVFFPPACAVTERKMLDVNKVHYVLACTSDVSALVGHIDAAVELARGESGLASVADYRKKFWQGNRFDPADVIYVKRMLQVALPEKMRARLTAELFHRHVSTDEYAFADDLYLTKENLREMLANGMEIGSHGYAHHWLDSLARTQQAEDIDRSIDLLERIGVSRNGFYFCYPYGAYTPETVDLLRTRNCAAAFTTRVGLCNPQASAMLEIPRLDTNDLPKSANAAAVAWTEQANRPN